MHEISLTTERRTQVLDITDLGALEAVLHDGAGRVLVYVPHTTAGVTINEHADPAVARDLETRHGADGRRQLGLGAHRGRRGERAVARARRAQPQVLIPLRDGQLALGTWQGIFFCEFDGPRERTVYVSPLQ